MPEKQERIEAESEGINKLADALRQAMQGGIAAAKEPPKSNPNYVEQSVYAPLGVPKVAQTRRYFWKNAEVDWRLITPDEAALFEQLQPGQYHVVSVVNTQGGPMRERAQWVVRHRTDGNTTELFIDFPAADSDQRASLPSMKAMLKEMVTGERAD